MWVHWNWGTSLAKIKWFDEKWTRSEMTTGWCNIVMEALLSSGGLILTRWKFVFLPFWWLVLVGMEAKCKDKKDECVFISERGEMEMVCLEEQLTWFVLTSFHHWHKPLIMHQSNIVFSQINATLALSIQLRVTQAIQATIKCKRSNTCTLP